MTTVDGPWFAVVDVEVADPMAADNWETAANVALSQDETEGRAPKAA